MLPNEIIESLRLETAKDQTQSSAHCRIPLTCLTGYHSASVWPVFRQLTPFWDCTDVKKKKNPLYLELKLPIFSVVLVLL